MFTGLIEATARVTRMTHHGPALDLTLDVGPEIAADLPLGASLAINGVCLTVEKSTGTERTFRAIEETLQKTNLGSLEAGSTVNVERALRVGDRLGGHWVQGHVDGVGILRARRDDPGQTELRVELSEALSRHFVPKGSVCLDGVSLTVVEVGPRHFTVCIIPETLRRTTVGSMQVGRRLNIETDILAKYVAKLFGADRGVNLEGLRRAGFLHE